MWDLLDSAEMSNIPRSQPSDSKERQRRWTEFAATILLSFGTTVASWSSYQGGLWNGVGSSSHRLAAERRVELTREVSVAGQFVVVDVAAFTGWVNAYVSGDDKLQRFYRQRFRPEFAQAFETWFASSPLTNPQAPATPFLMPSYRSEHLKRASELEREAQELTQAATIASHHADVFMRSNVLLALLLFFGGISLHFQNMEFRWVLLGVATLLLMYGLVTVLALPSADRNPSPNGGASAAALLLPQVSGENPAPSGQ